MEGYRKNLIVAFELLLFGLITYFLRIRVLYLLVGAITLTVMAIILYFVAKCQKKEKLYYICCIINLFATALTVNIYYVSKKISIDIYEQIFVLLVGLILHVIFNGVIEKTRGKKAIISLIYIFLGIALVASIVGWTTQENKFLYSYAFFIWLFVIMLLSANIKERADKNEMQNFVIMHFFAFFIVAIVIAIVASEGEAIGDFAEGAIIGSVDGQKGKKKKK